MANNTKTLRHVGFIMDGNGRWAKSKGKSRNYGHIEGSNRVEEIVTACFSMGIECVSLYAFSTENWARPKEEVDKILGILKTFLTKHKKALLKNQVRLVVSGDKTKLPLDVQLKISDVESITSKFSGRTLNVAVNYGGRQDIVNAVNSLISKGETTVTEQSLNSMLYTGELPEIDLVIRTSGEQRLSNFFIWQTAYAELYFTEVLWPDFSKEELEKAVKWYYTRERRFRNV